MCFLRITHKNNTELVKNKYLKNGLRTKCLVNTYNVLTKNYITNVLLRITHRMYLLRVTHRIINKNEYLKNGLGTKCQVKKNKTMTNWKFYDWRDFDWINKLLSKEYFAGINTAGYQNCLNTIISRIGKLLVIASDPSFNPDEISHKRRNVAFQNGRVSSNNVFWYYFSFVVLIHHYKRIGKIRGWINVSVVSGNQYCRKTVRHPWEIHQNQFEWIFRENILPCEKTTIYRY